MAMFDDDPFAEVWDSLSVEERSWWLGNSGVIYLPEINGWSSLTVESRLQVKYAIRLMAIRTAAMVGLMRRDEV